MLSGRAPKIVWSGDRYDPRWSSAAVSEWVCLSQHECHLGSRTFSFQALLLTQAAIWMSENALTWWGGYYAAPECTHVVRWVLFTASAVAMAVAPSSPIRLKLRSRTCRAVSHFSSWASLQAPSDVMRLLHQTRQRKVYYAHYNCIRYIANKCCYGAV